MSEAAGLGTAESSIKEAVRRIVAEFRPKRIILFGSHAYGQPDKDSDLDFLVVMATEANPYERAVPLRKSLRDIGMPKDVIVRTPEEYERFKDIVGSVIYTASHQGRVLYER